jgi:hypothetical protein
MTHYARTLLSALVAVVLAAGGIVRGEIICINADGQMVIEAVGECKELRSESASGERITTASCIDIPLAEISTGPSEPNLPHVLPPQSLLDTVALVTPVITQHVQRTGLDAASPSLSATLTRTVVLLI